MNQPHRTLIPRHRPGRPGACRPACRTGPRRSPWLSVLALVALLAAPTATMAQGNSIGVASSVVRSVTGNAGGAERPLSVGSDVFEAETVETGDQSNSQLMFRDETTLSIGPSSSVVLDRFVYDPGGRASTFSVRAARGALRFVSGSSRPSAYQIRTPVATIGVRGTIVDVFVQGALTIVILTEGAADVCVNGRCSGLTRPGTYLVVRAGGATEGPRPWDGSLRSIIGPVSFPLYGWHLDLDRGPRFRNEPARIGEVDQIDARDVERERPVRPPYEPPEKPPFEPPFQPFDPAERRPRG